MAKRRTAAPARGRQEEQHRLLDEALQEPGIAEAIEAYRRFGDVTNAYRREVHSVGFSTGGNYPTDQPTQ